ncbi:helix-turn-helix domain-containing protein [Arthrobacter sp. HY1533]|uniref:helix-turn-helix domain-containing protein n=1 Tax=Arthrobacter sp. HY1533 TaxID=2970919 RepID=UPI003FA475F5
MSSQPNQFVPNFAGESRSQAVARRLRGQIAESSLTQTELEARSGISQQKISRLTRGRQDIKIVEVEQLANAAGFDLDYILTGIKRQTPPTGGGVNLSLHTESNRRPFHYE